jgi:hypothetical protein
MRAETMNPARLIVNAKSKNTQVSDVTEGTEQYKDDKTFIGSAR